MFTLSVYFEFGSFFSPGAAFSLAGRIS